jgi:hypothetical protein
MLDRAVRRRFKTEEAGWHLSAVDPDGCDVVGGDKALRLSFAEPLASPDHLIAALGGLADNNEGS